MYYVSVRFYIIFNLNNGQNIVKKSVKIKKIYMK